MTTTPRKTNPRATASLERLDPGEAMLLADVNRRKGDATALARDIGIGQSTLLRAISGERLRPSVRAVVRHYLEKLRAA